MMQKEKHKKLTKNKLFLMGESFVQQFSLDSVTILSNGMVYSTLVAIVPCLTLIYAVLNLFGVLDPAVAFLEGYILEAFGETTGANLLSYLRVFTENAMSMGVVSLLSFFVTFVLLVDKVYTIVNRLYHTEKKGNVATRFLKYGGTILLGLLVVCFLIYFIGRFNPFALAGKLGFPALSAFERAFRGIMPLAILFFSLFGIIVMVPNTKVRFQSAVLGSAVGTVGVTILTRIFKIVVAFSVKYSVIYGSMAALLFFFMFLSYLWKIIFCSVVLSYVHQCTYYGVEYKL